MKNILFVFLILSARIASGQSMADTSVLKQSVNTFMEASDRADITAISAMYDISFENIRVTAQGEMINLNRSQILHILQNPGRQVIPTQSTTIYHVEVIGDMGFVLLTRIKNLGNGWEPMFYSLVWRYSGGKWLLLREFVYQKSLPARH